MTDQAPAPSKVAVSVGGCSVTVEAGEPLDKVHQVARSLVLEFGPADRPGPGSGITTGFASTGTGSAVKQRGGDWRPIRAEQE